MGQVVGRQLGVDVAFQEPGVLGGAAEVDLGPRVRRQRVVEFAGELAQVLVGQDQRQPVPAGLGEELFEPVGQGEEVLALIHIQTRRGAQGLAGAGPGGGGLPHPGDHKAAQQPGGVIAQQPLGHPDQADPTIQHRTHVEARGGGADHITHKGAQEEGAQAGHDRPHQLGLGGGALLLIPGPKPPQPDRVVQPVQVGLAKQLGRRAGGGCR